MITFNFHKAADLAHLLGALRSYGDAIARTYADGHDLEAEALEHTLGRAMAGLPNFGGEEPSDTSGVWSWNETHLLVGDGYADLGIVSREEW